MGQGQPCSSSWNSSSVSSSVRMTLLLSSFRFSWISDTAERRSILGGAREAEWGRVRVMLGKFFLLETGGCWQLKPLLSGGLSEVFRTCWVVQLEPRVSVGLALSVSACVEPLLMLIISRSLSVSSLVSTLDCGLSLTVWSQLTPLTSTPAPARGSRQLTPRWKFSLLIRAIVLDLSPSIDSSNKTTFYILVPPTFSISMNEMFDISLVQTHRIHFTHYTSCLKLKWCSYLVQVYS